MAKLPPLYYNTTTGKVTRYGSGDSVTEIYGGTGNTSYTAGDTLYSDATNTLAKLNIGSAGQVMVSAGGFPTWGVALLAGGGTGLSSYTAGDMLYYVSGTLLSKLAIGTSGYILTSTGTAPQWTSSAGIGLTSLSNTTGSTIAKFSAVYASADGEITKARCDSTSTSGVVGLVTADISTSASGNVYTRRGDVVTGTTGEWDALAGTTGGLAYNVRYYLSGSTAGSYTATVPSTAGYSVFCIGTGLSTTKMELILEWIAVI